MNNIHHLNLLNSAPRIMGFSKECTAENQEILVEKLDRAIASSIIRLSELDIIPKKIKIDENNNVYEISPNKVETKVRVQLDYYDFRENSIDKQNEISNKIREENKLKTLISTKKHTIIGRFKRRLHLLPESVCGTTTIVKGQTQEELLKNLQQSLWSLLKTEEESTKRIVGFEVNHFNFYKLSDCYQAEYRYILFKGMRFQNKKTDEDFERD